MRKFRIQDIAERLDRTVTHTYFLSRQPDFPPPIETIGTVKFWSAEDVNFWRKTRVDGRTTEGRARKRRK